MSDSFLCILCNRNRRSKVKHIREFKLCGDCYHLINNDYRRTRNNSVKKHHTKCVICGRDIDHYSVAPTCKTGTCRSRWYNDLERIKKIKNFILTEELDEISDMKVSKITSLGFKIMLKEKEAVA